MTCLTNMISGVFYPKGDIDREYALSDEEKGIRSDVRKKLEWVNTVVKIVAFMTIALALLQGSVLSFIFATALIYTLTEINQVAKNLLHIMDDKDIEKTVRASKKALIQKITASAPLIQKAVLWINPPLEQFILAQ